MLRRRLDRGSAEPTVSQVVDAHDLLAMRESVEQVSVHEDVLHYVVSLAAASRHHPQVAVGASPRAEIDLVQLARARALLLGRDYVIPETSRRSPPPPWRTGSRCGRRCGYERFKAPTSSRTCFGGCRFRERAAVRSKRRNDVIEIREVHLAVARINIDARIATCAAFALALGLIRSCWQLIAFAAPLLGVFCSISWQRPLPKVNVHAEPGSQRCFETEQAQLTVWATTENHGVAVKLAVSAVDGMRLDVVDRISRQRQTVATAAERWGRYPIGAAVEVITHGGLLTGTGTVDAADVAVFPMTPPQATVLPQTELLDRLGTRLTRHIGRGVEYADIRTYVPGDQLRTVNWPVSARRGRLHVTQRLTDRSADVVVLVDGYPQPAGPATESTERTVRGAAQVVQTALRNGDRAGIVALGGRQPRWLGADIGQRRVLSGARHGACRR